MKQVSAILTVAAVAAVAIFTGVADPQSVQSGEKPVRLALMCFKSGEEMSGLNKICYYNCAGSRAAITIKSTSLCPISIDR